MDNPSSEAVGSEIPPPILYAGPLIAGILLSRLHPGSFLPRWLARPIGLALTLAGLGLGATAMREMRRAGTSPMPSTPTRALVREGPYQLTRNPMYVGMSLIYAGFALFFDALGAIILLPVVIGVTDKRQIQREEAYLDRQFGDEYRSYTDRVPRWV